MHLANPDESLKFTGSLPTYEYLFQLSGFLGSTPVLGSAVKNLPLPRS